MKPTPLTLLIVVTACVCFLCCDSKPWSSSVPYYGNSMAFGNWDADGFEVDGKKYKCIGACRGDAGGHENLSWIVVYPIEGKNRYSIATASNRNKVEGFICHIDSDDNEISRIGVPANNIYFIKNRMIVDSQTNMESGLDTKDTKIAFSQENLQPILEKMIREKVKKNE